MTQVIVDEAMLREPNLWRPGIVPNGPVKIDWGNPLTAGLKLAWVASNKVNLVDGRFPDQDGTTLTTTSKGIARSFNGTAAGAIYWNEEYLQGSVGGGAGFYTIIARGQTDQSAPHVLAGQKWDPSGAPAVQVCLGLNFNGSLTYNSAYAAGWEYTTTIRTASYNSNDSGLNTWSLAKNHSNAGELYKNGIFQASGVSFVNDFTDGTRKTLIGHGGVGLADNTDCLTGVMDFVFMFDRYISAGEQMTIYNDPFQFLIPA